MTPVQTSSRDRSFLRATTRSPLRGALALLSVALLPACSGQSDGASSEPSGSGPESSTSALGHCSYTNPFSKSPECRDYLGKGWSEKTATEDCSEQSGKFVAGASCSYGSVLGRCVLNEGKDDAYQLVFPGNDTAQCASVQRGCELFAKGHFLPDPQCKNADPGTSTGGGSVFEPPTLECRAPVAGEPAGASNGKVCTWSGIAACTEPGRKYEEYGSCDTVRTQRPYYPAPPAGSAASDDPRLKDTAYMQEVAWAREQVESCACVCCHSNRLAPQGPSNWFVEAQPIWVDSFTPRGLALGAGWVDSTVLGAFPPAQNNGFDRSASGVPSTDPQRMKRFFEQELTRRGYTQADFANAPPFGGFLYDQLKYKPTACQNGEGVDARGRVSWVGGDARYVYVLKAGSANPGVPPNLDLPSGTIWRLDVRPDANPVQSGIAYGSTPEGTRQHFPEEGSPAALASGTTYYIYVLADVGLPVTRCLFNYPG